MDITGISIVSSCGAALAFYNLYAYSVADTLALSYRSVFILWLSLSLVSAACTPHAGKHTWNLAYYNGALQFFVACYATLYFRHTLTADFSFVMWLSVILFLIIPCLHLFLAARHAALHPPPPKQ